MATWTAARYVSRVPYNREAHHRHSVKLNGYDYSEPGAYFITICTYQREMLLADRLVRYIVSSAWHDLPRRFGAVAIHQFVIMPNHVHGIIWITRATAVGAQHSADSNSAAPSQKILDDSEVASKQCAAPLRHIAVGRGSLGVVIRAFKSQSAKRINRFRKTLAQRSGRATTGSESSEASAN